jgi:SAM-dependent methyltransferase
VIRTLPRVLPPQGEQPGAADESHPMRKVTREVAFEPEGWTPERAATVAAVFDGLAPQWDATHDDPGRYDPLVDALARGGNLPPPCVELGAGTGLGTRFLAPRFGSVVAVDLSAGMLRRADPTLGIRVQADGAHLPIARGSVGTLVLVNALLFPPEVRRVVAPDGAVVWVNTNGDGTPIYLPAEDVAAALGPGWSGVASEAGWGTWVVLRRTGE